MDEFLYTNDDSAPCLATRRPGQHDTVVRIGNVPLGGGNFAVIAGPCAVESQEQLAAVTDAVRGAGALMLRGGAFKPRTSPYAFQGLREQGLELLICAGRRAGMPVVSEITDASQLPLFEQVDMLQVGARSMQNFELLRELGQTRKPILLKRGMMSTLDELLWSAEHILAAGNPNVVLCERGIRTFEPSTRNTLDLSAVPVLRARTHLPVIVDPSHAAGERRLVAPLARAAVAAGADGLMIEVHCAPEEALSDGAQALSCCDFACLMPELTQLRALIARFAG